MTAEDRALPRLTAADEGQLSGFHDQKLNGGDEGAKLTGSL
jgi:hypothetical protein